MRMRERRRRDQQAARARNDPAPLIEELRLARLESITPGGTPSLDAVKGDIKNILIKQKQIDNLVGPAEKLAQAAAA